MWGGSMRRNSWPGENKCPACYKTFLVGGAGRPRRTQKYCSLKCSTRFSHLGHSRVHRPATATPTSLDIAWAAGIYEGEGHCGRRYYAEVTQKDGWVPQRLAELFGGAAEQTAFKHGIYWRWWITGTRARGFLMTIYMFLSPRRKEQVRIALRGQNATQLRAG